MGQENPLTTNIHPIWNRLPEYSQVLDLIVINLSQICAGKDGLACELYQALKKRNNTILCHVLQ